MIHDDSTESGTVPPANLLMEIKLMEEKAQLNSRKSHVSQLTYCQFLYIISILCNIPCFTGEDT
jgi:hypothetical protein